MTKQEILDDVSELYSRIDGCISALITARLNKDDCAEADAIFEMETLIVDSQQELSLIKDYLEGNQC